MGWPPELNYCEHNKPVGYCDRCYRKFKKREERSRKKEEKERKKIFKKRSEASKKGWQTRRRNEGQ